MRGGCIPFCNKSYGNAGYTPDGYRPEAPCRHATDRCHHISQYQEYTGCNKCRISQGGRWIQLLQYQHGTDPKNRGNEAYNDYRNGECHVRHHHVIANHCCSRNGDGRDDSADIGFKEVSAHPCYISDIIPDVVCNNCRVSWVILRNTGLYLTSKISSDICGLRIDTSTYPRKKGNGTCPHRITTDNRSCCRIMPKHIEKYTNAYHTNTGYCKSHDRTPGKGDKKGLCRIRLIEIRRIGSPDIGTRGGIHAKKPCQHRRDGTAQIGYSRLIIQTYC